MPSRVFKGFKRLYAVVVTLAIVQICGSHEVHGSIPSLGFFFVFIWTACEHERPTLSCPGLGDPLSAAKEGRGS
ncbi:hypothetical protein C8R43DRAFT_1045065, partial [Mycena crocata]